jgi:hypothetical protein
LDTTNLHRSSTTYRARARIELKLATADQGVESGAVKNRRRTLRPLAKAASIMDIVEAIEDAVVAEVDTEDEEVMAEMVNQDEDVEGIAVEAIHRPLCNNCSLATIWTIKGLSFRCIKTLLARRFPFRLRMSKSYYSSFERVSLPAMHCEILETRLGVFECV